MWVGGVVVGFFLLHLIVNVFCCKSFEAKLPEEREHPLTNCFFLLASKKLQLFLLMLNFMLALENIFHFCSILLWFDVSWAWPNCLKLMEVFCSAFKRIRHLYRRKRHYFCLCPLVCFLVRFFYTAFKTTSQNQTYKSRHVANHVAVGITENAAALLGLKKAKHWCRCWDKCRGNWKVRKWHPPLHLISCLEFTSSFA